MASESTAPAPPSGGGAKYAIVGIVLFAIAALVWCATRPGDETSAVVVARAPDAGTLQRPTALVEEDFVIPEPEPDAGPPPDAGVPVAPTKRGAGAPRSWADCTGDIPQAEARRVLAEFQTQIRNCYERQLKLNPLLQGTVQLTLHIAPDGRVDGSQMSGTLHDRNVAACIRQVTSHMRFPAPGGRDCALVSVPLSFTPRE